VASDDDEGAGKGGDRIKIGVEHGGMSENEYITQHAATDAVKHAEECKP